MKITRKTRIVIVLSLVLSYLSFARELPNSSPEDVGMSSEKLAQAKSSVQALVD
ncbi:unnamed protein product, partial [marine sediment metagenome]